MKTAILIKCPKQKLRIIQCHVYSLYIVLLAAWLICVKINVT